MINKLKKNFKNITIKIYLKIFEEPKIEIKDCEKNKRLMSNIEIPLVCYQTWEEKKFYKSHARGLNKFRKLNPELKFKIYDANERDNFMRKEWGKHKIYEIYINEDFQI